MSADADIRALTYRTTPLSRPDRRVSRTRRALAEALLGLVKEKRYEDVTVQEIIDRAEVSRSTFYVHFVDKDDLLLELYRVLRSRHGGPGEAAPDAATTGEREPFSWAADIFEWGRALRAEFEDKANGVWSIGQSEACFVALAELDHELAVFVRADLARAAGIASSAVPDWIVEFATKALVSMLVKWIDGGVREPVDEMTARFRTLTVPGVLAALEGEVAAARRPSPGGRSAAIRR